MARIPAELRLRLCGGGSLEVTSVDEDRMLSQVHLASRLALRPREAAAVLGVSERTLRGFLPEIPHLREGGVVLIPVDSLRNWLRERAKAEQSRVIAAVDEVLQDLGK